MRRARFLAAAREDLFLILDYVSETSGSVAVAEGLVARLRTKCHQLAAYDITIGRPRSEVGRDLRSVPFGNYVILFRYRSDAFEIVNIIERHRDIETRFDEIEDT